MLKDGKILIAKSKEKELFIEPSMANRHGLITGASGSGKTITLKVMAESFASLGVPVFLSDIKGDLAATCMPGASNENLESRLSKLSISSFDYKGFPTIFWDVFGKNGHPVRATMASIGPTILARMLGLNETQEGVLAIIYKISRENGYELTDLKDLRLLLQYIAENSKEYTIKYGNVASQSVGTIQRALLRLEEEGATSFFGEPEIDIKDFIRTNESGIGNINILDCVELYKKPTLYACFLLWLLNTINNELPEVGDLEKPKMVFFFDEAHLLFDDLPGYMLTNIIQIVKLIRSKGVGLYFISQSPNDVPGEIIAQLGNKVQHTLRAYTPAEQKVVKAVADSYRSNPEFDTEKAILELGTGEAVVSFLNEKGEPNVVEVGTVLPPQSQMGTLDDSMRLMIISRSEFKGKYDTPIDRESAFEILSKEMEEKEAEKMAEEQKKLDEKAEKEAEKQAAKEEKEQKKLEKEAEIARKNSMSYKVEKAASKAVSRTTSSAFGTIGRKIGNEIIKSLFK